MKEIKTGVYIYNNESYNFNFCTDLSVANKLGFVNSVVNLLVDEEHYNSVIRDLIFDFYVVDIMTDIDTTKFKNSPNFLNDVEEFLENTNIIEVVKANAFPTLFDELNKAVDNSVIYLTGIHNSPVIDSLTNLISTLEKKINEINLSDMADMAQKFANMTGELTPESIMNAYINSDIHKENLAEIIKAKK